MWFSTNAQSWVPHFLSPDNYWFNAIVYGSTNFIATGTNGIISSSSDTTNWTACEIGNLSSLRSVVFAQNQFVAVGDNGTIKTSTNGSVWVPQNSGITSNVVSLAYGNGTFAAVGDAGLVLTSGDGVNWTNQVVVKNAGGWRIAFGNGVFVAALGTKLYSSSNAVDWIVQTNPPSVTGLGFGGGQFVAGTGAGSIYTSADGFTWMQQNAPSGIVHVWTVSFGNGLYVAAGYYANSVLTSSDGVNWTNRPTHFNGNSISSMIFANGAFVAAADNGFMITSTNGIDWVPQQTPASKELFGVAYGNGSYVFVGDNGTTLQSSSDSAGSPILTGTYLPLEGIQLSVQGEAGSKLSRPSFECVSSSVVARFFCLHKLRTSDELRGSCRD